jgi:hypothetical protein
MDYADPQWLMELLGEHLEEMNRHFADNGLHPALRQQEVWDTLIHRIHVLEFQLLVNRVVHRLEMLTFLGGSIIRLY